MTRISEILNIPQGVTAVVGGGGKTSLIWRLACELSEHAHVLIATTTHIRPPACTTLLSPTRGEIATAFRGNNLIAVGDPAENGKLAEVKALLGDYDALADYVLIEADGSRGLPLKAPAAHEPVLPGHTDLTIAVAGMACAGQTIAEAAHRPELYAALLSLSETETVTPAIVAQVLQHPKGQRKEVRGRFAVVLNQADTPLRLAFGRAVATDCREEVLITALQTLPERAEHWLNGVRHQS